MKPAEKAQFIIVSSFLLLVLLFNNCSQQEFASFPTKANGSGNPQEVCFSELLKVYEKTWFPILKVSCNSCHGAGHGSTDLRVSFEGFENMNEARIRNNATTNHKENHFELTNNLSKINSFSQEWSAAVNAYDKCVP